MAHLLRVLLSILRRGAVPILLCVLVWKRLRGLPLWTRLRGLPLGRDSEGCHFEEIQRAATWHRLRALATWKRRLKLSWMQYMVVRQWRQQTQNRRAVDKAFRGLVMNKHMVFRRRRLIFDNIKHRRWVWLVYTMRRRYLHALKSWHWCRVQERDGRRQRRQLDGLD